MAIVQSSQVLTVYLVIYVAWWTLLFLTFLACQHCTFCIMLQLVLVKCYVRECERVTKDTCKG